MYLSKVKLEEIKSKYPTLVLMDDDIADAFNMVSDILTAEADAIKEKERMPPPPSIDWKLPHMKFSLYVGISKTKILMRGSKL